MEDGAEFDRVVEMVREVGKLGMEVCCHSRDADAAAGWRLRDAGLTAYNHNLDTSEEHYESIISTRGYSDRLATIRAVRDAGIQVCCGGIVGLDESEEDRISLLHTLTNLDPQPESVPVNGLVRVAGTPLADRPAADRFGFGAHDRGGAAPDAARARTPRGRADGAHPEAQALAFLAGANSIFHGDRLLTTPNPGEDADEALLEKLGLGDRAAARVSQQ